MGSNDARGTNGNPKKASAGSGMDWSRITRRRDDSGLSWYALDHAALVNLIDTANKRGMGVSFSAGRAGDFLCITFLDGPDRPKFYYNSVEDADTGVAELLDQMRS